MKMSYSVVIIVGILSIKNFYKFVFYLVIEVPILFPLYSCKV